MNYTKATANYNMRFDKGKFIKDKEYKYRINPEDLSQVLITTEEGTKQDLWYSEFDILFTLLKN